MTTLYLVYTPNTDPVFKQYDTKPFGIILPQRILKVENYIDTNIDSAKITFDSETITPPGLPGPPGRLPGPLRDSNQYTEANLGGGARIKKNTSLGKKTRKVRAAIRLE
jgi:hypothetical protein